MKLYKITCFSDCGSYFASYLQSVTVVAEDKNWAIIAVEKWLDKNDLLQLPVLT